MQRRGPDLWLFASRINHSESPPLNEQEPFHMAKDKPKLCLKYTRPPAKTGWSLPCNDNESLQIFLFLPLLQSLLAGLEAVMEM